ncbi:MAG TPA: methylenetetrahydrofolate reductase [Jiangellaceae bacterium]|nr:methylenetetrahydrofolate reductase [Jiangellaceae bacterium]
MTTVVERLQERQPVFSVEFFPPKDDASEEVLWRAIRELEVLDPAYVSVTYGAGGSNRDRTIRTTGRIAEETTLTPVAHLTGVGHSITELRNVVGWYAERGIRNVLVIRGDPPGDPLGEWIPHPEGIMYASDLVELVSSLGSFCTGVAAVPTGHPRSPDLEVDADHVAGKIRAGAEFVVGQMCFDPEDFLRLRDRLAARGCGDVPLLPGIMPLTTTKTLGMVTHLTGIEPPASLRQRLAPFDDDPDGFRAEGLDVVAEMCDRLLREGVPGLHFYTLNRSTATRELVDRLGLAQQPQLAGAAS